MENKNFGYFDDKNREFVITNPATPFPWINYLGNEDFFGLISNTGGGYDFYKDAKFRRITRYRYNGVPMDNGGRYFYINDNGTVWNPGWKPCKTPLDFYECRHGMNYTRITGSKNGIEASVLFFVPLKTWAEIQKVTLKNTTSEKKTIKLFSFAEWCLWNAATDMENFQRNWSTGEVEIDGATIYHKTEYKERRNHYAYYTVTNAKIDGYDTDRESFIGLYNEFADPQCVMAGKPSNSLAHGWSPIASHYIEVELAPGESKDFIFMLGYVENAQEEKFSAEDIERNKVRADLGITYDEDVLRLRGEFMERGFFVGSVVITHYNGQPSAKAYSERLANMGIKSYFHYLIDGYPHNVALIASDEGFGKNDYVETSRELVIVTAPGPGSGKMAVCLSQLYNENKRGVRAGSSTL